jgi:hypothetical protein
VSRSDRPLKAVCAIISPTSIVPCHTPTSNKNVLFSSPAGCIVGPVWVYGYNVGVEVHDLDMDQVFSMKFAMLEVKCNDVWWKWGSNPMFVLLGASYRHRSQQQASLDSTLISPVLYLNHRSKSRMMGEVHRRPSAYLALALRRRRRCFSTPPNGLNVQNGLCFGPGRPTTAILPTLRDPKQNATRVGQRVTEAKCRGQGGVPSSNTGI